MSGYQAERFTNSAGGLVPHKNTVAARTASTWMDGWMDIELYV